MGIGDCLFSEFLEKLNVLGLPNGSRDYYYHTLLGISNGGKGYTRQY